MQEKAEKTRASVGYVRANVRACTSEISVKIRLVP
jgi:hypothetical protein